MEVIPVKVLLPVSSYLLRCYIFGLISRYNSTPISDKNTRLAYEAFYLAIRFLPLYEFVTFDGFHFLFKLWLICYKK